MNNCMYCDQLMKPGNTNLFHDNCKNTYYKKADFSTKKLRDTNSFPSINVRRNGHLEKIFICSECQFPVTRKMLSKINKYIEEKKITTTRGFCLRCTKSKYHDKNRMEEKRFFLKHKR